MEAPLSPTNASKTKSWSLEEANRAVPIVTKVFDKIFELNGQAESLDKDMEILRDIWGLRLFEHMNPDFSYYQELKRQRSALKLQIGHAVSKLQEAGCAIDDKEQGVIHFLHSTPRGLAAFCWKYGEQKVEHWHDVGQSARQKAEFTKQKA